MSHTEKRNLIRINYQRESSELELENFLLTAQEIFFNNIPQRKLEVGSNAENFLLKNLISMNDSDEYSAFIGLRLCGYEIWSFTDNNGYYYRRPGELEFKEIKK